MPTLTLNEAGDGKASYALDLGDEVVRLVNPQGNVVAMFSRAEAVSSILLPTTNPPRPSISVRVGRDQLVHLGPEPTAIAALRAYLGSEAVAAPALEESSSETTFPNPPARSVARDTVIGAVISLVGVALVLVGLLELGRGLLGWVLLVIGVLVTLIGAGWVYEARRRGQSSNSARS